MTRTHDETEFGFQIAPMLDVLFVLLLFFMVMAGMQKVETNIKVPLPGGGSVGNVPVVLDILSNGQVVFNGTPMDTTSSRALPETSARLQAALADSSHRPIIIRPAEDTRHQRVMDVLDLCKAVHAQNVAFSRVTD